MGSRLAVHIKAGKKTYASIYDHHGGHLPEDVKTTIDTFIEDLGNVPDNRWADPNYLAAKYVVWAATNYRRFSGKTNPLDFLSVGVGIEQDVDAMSDAAVVLHSDKEFGMYTITRTINLEDD